MPNLYGVLANVKADIGQTQTTYDAHILRLIERVSRAVDDYTGRRFYSEIATRYYDGSGTRELWLTDDLISVDTSLKVDDDGDGTYDITLAATTDYWLYPDNKTPKFRVDLNPDGTQISVWPKARRSVQIIGMFGYSNDTELTGQTVQNTTEISASGTTLTVTSTTGISAGETLVMGSEQVYVSAVASATDLTITRGLNGTTAAIHANAVAIYRRRYAAPIEEAVMMQVSRLWNAQKTGGGQVGSDDVGGFSFSSTYPVIRDLLNPYRMGVFA